MAKFRGAVLTCKACGSEFKVPPSRAETAEFCSVACKWTVVGKRMQKRIKLTCAHCGDEFETFPSHRERRVYCSDACRHASPASWQNKSEQTRGSKNPMWKGGGTDRADGYRYAYAPEHPFSWNGYVLEHRLVMERWLRENEPDSPFLIRLGALLYLSPDFIVHHHDENRRNNAIENLSCMTIAEHNRHHSRARDNH